VSLLERAPGAAHQASCSSPDSAGHPLSRSSPDLLLSASQQAAAHTQCLSRSQDVKVARFEGGKWYGWPAVAHGDSLPRYCVTDRCCWAPRCAFCASTLRLLPRLIHSCFALHKFRPQCTCQKEQARALPVTSSSACYQQQCKPCVAALSSYSRSAPVACLAMSA